VHEPSDLSQHGGDAGEPVYRLGHTNRAPSSREGLREASPLSDIFVSWGSPDASIARPLIERLRDDGLRVWEYETSMTSGDDIPDRVRTEIQGALTVVVLVSPHTKDRAWVLTELILALDSRDRGEVWHVIPVRLGGLAHEQLPETVRLRNLHSLGFEEAGGQEEALARLVLDIQAGLGDRAPLIVPTALLAMTREEFRTVFPPDSSRSELLERICCKVGMRGHPTLYEELEQRYGDRSEDFAPFDPYPLTELVQAAQRSANDKRTARGHAPVHLRWMSRDAFEDQGLRHLWQRHHSFLIVDSVSTFAPTISTHIQNLPHMTDGRNLAVMWVPPYTRHTVELESLIQASLQPPFLADNFDAWRGRNIEYPYLTFDVATATTLKRWVAQTLDSFSSDERPHPGNVERFAGLSPRGQVRPSAFFGSTGAGEMP
jgi:hypothetical protein